MTKEQKICDILAREYPEVYADIEKQVGEVKSEEMEMFVARDEDGTGHIFYDKPFEDSDDWDDSKFWSSLDDCIIINDNHFPSVQFANSPKRVKLILED